jgi:hypothetical protein
MKPRVAASSAAWGWLFQIANRQSKISNLTNPKQPKLPHFKSKLHLPKVKMKISEIFLTPCLTTG